MRKGADVNGSKPRKNADSIATSHAITEIYWRAIREDEVHFGVRHAHGFNHVFHGSTDIKVVRYSLHPPFGWKKVV